MKCTVRDLIIETLRERGRVLAAMIVIRLQTIVAREIALTESAVVSVGSLQAPAPSATSSVIMRFCS